MMVGFPPFHAENKRNLDKRIMNGVVRFPKDIDPDAQDLIEWLLAKNPCDRPEEFSEVKRHNFFKNIHWGRVARKQAIPPWTPDLYTWHAPKRFTSIPLNQVFYNVSKKRVDSASYNSKHKPTAQMNGSIYAFDQNSKRETREKHGHGGYKYEDELYLEGIF